MGEFLHSLTSIQPPFNMFVLVALFGCTAGVVNNVIRQIRRFACHRQELDLKRELIDRGMSVDDIERIVRASSGAAGDKSSWLPTPVQACAPQ